MPGRVTFYTGRLLVGGDAQLSSQDGCMRPPVSPPGRNPRQDRDDVLFEERMGRGLMHCPRLIPDGRLDEE